MALKEDHLALDREQLMSGGQKFCVGFVKGPSFGLDIAVNVKESEKDGFTHYPVHLSFSMTFNIEKKLSTFLA
jgi:hypothetical protein